MRPEVGLGDAGERLGGNMEELAQEIVEEDDAQRTVPRALDIAKVEVELGAVDLEAERELEGGCWPCWPLFFGRVRLGLSCVRKVQSDRPIAFSCPHVQYGQSSELNIQI